MRMSKWWQNFHILAELFLAQGDSDDIWSIVGSNLQPVGYQLTSLTSRPYNCGLDWHLVSEANDLWPLWGWAGCSERDKCDGRTDEGGLCDDLSVSTVPLLFSERVHLPGWHLLGTRGQPATLSPVLAGRTATAHIGSINKWMLISPATGNQCCQTFCPCEARQHLPQQRRFWTSGAVWISMNTSVSYKTFKISLRSVTECSYLWCN